MLMACLAVAEDGDDRDEPGDDTRTEVWQVGYLDIGWFDAQGDGVSYQRDVAHRVLGKGADGRLTDAPWVFYGDPWANMVNSQGDSADLGLDRTNIDRFDPIASGGRPTFIVNRFHHGLMLQRGQTVGIRARFNFEPRAGSLGRLGDVFSVDTAYLRWTPFRHQDVTFYAGRIESGFGWEYRDRHASSRFGITPSIVSRYLVGRQTGVRVRGTVHRWFNYSLALTNGGTITERFGHFNNELDVNGVPTVTARVGALIRRPVRVELGVSGQVGPKDGQPDPALTGWQVGVDGRLDADELSVSFEGVITRQPEGLDLGDSLRAHGGYIGVDYRMTPQTGLYGRVDWRDAEMLAGPNLYVSNVMRWTVGVRFELDDDVFLKAEYLHLDELPHREVHVVEGHRWVDVRDGTDISNDVFTTSLVFRYRTRRRAL